MRAWTIFFLAILAANVAVAAPRGARVPYNASATLEEVEGTERDQIVAKVEAYLSGIPSIIANFSQTSSDGSAGTGKFFLKRPGKMRWQYNPPAPILIVSDGKVVTYYDAGLDQISYIGIDDTLATLMTKKEIKLESNNVHLTKVEHGGGVIHVTMVQKKKPDEGSMTLELKENPLEIKRLITLDATGNETIVTLKNTQFGPVLDDKLFIFEDPRSVNDRRNRKGRKS